MQQAVAAEQAHTLRNRVLASLAIFVVLATAIVMMVSAVSVTSDTIGAGFSEAEQDVVVFQGNPDAEGGATGSAAASNEVNAQTTAKSAPRKAAKYSSLYAVVDSNSALAAASDASNSGYLDLDNFFDHALAYGIVADTISFGSQVHANFATNLLKFDSATPMDYGNNAARVIGDGRVPNIAGTVVGLNGSSSHGELQVRSDSPSIFYVGPDPNNQNIVHRDHIAYGAVVTRNLSEIEDKVELLQSRTLNQAAELLQQTATIVLPYKDGDQKILIDTTSYGDDATIYIDYSALQNDPHPVEITKKANQTLVFNFDTTGTAYPPYNTKLTVIDGGSTRVVYANNYQTATAAEHEMWKHLVFNFPNAEYVKCDRGSVGGVFLVGNKNSDIELVNGLGWIISNGTVTCGNSWYGFAGVEEPFKSVTVTKVFHDATIASIDPNFAIDIKTCVNEQAPDSTQGELIDKLVFRSQDSGNFSDKEIGYTSAVPEGGNVKVTWVTSDLAVGNLHEIFEENARVSGKNPLNIDITTNRVVIADHQVSWKQETISGTEQAKTVGVFGISDVDASRNVVSIDNYYVDKGQYDLSISKKVTGNGFTGNETYSFIIKLTDENGQVVKQDGTLHFKKYSPEGVVVHEGDINVAYKQYTSPEEYSGEFTLNKDQKIVFTDIPKDWHYEIVEVVPENAEYYADYLNDSGQLNWDKRVVVTNRYEPKTTTLVVTKTVNGEGLLPDNFEIHVNEKDGSSKTIALLPKKPTSKTTENGSTVYTWKLRDVLVDAEYTVEEKNTQKAGYTLTSSARVNGVASEYDYKADIAIVDDPDANHVDFTNIYEVEPTEADLQATKVLKDSQGTPIRLTSGQFSFLAQEAEESKGVFTAKSNVEPITRGNNASGAINFGELEGLEPGIHYYILSEDISGLTDMDTEGLYLAQVEVRQATSVGEITSVVADNTDNVKVTITFNAPEAGEYLILPNPNSDKWQSQGSISSSGGKTSFSFNAKAYGPGLLTYYLAKLHQNDANADALAIIQLLVSVDWNNGGKRTVESFSLDSYGENSGGASAPTITYYELKDDGSGRYTKLSEKSPVFTNTLKAETQKAEIQLKKSDENGKLLDGAVFKITSGSSVVPISSGDGSGVTINALESGETASVDSTTTNTFTVPRGGVKISGLSDGAYSIEEVDPPAGYVISNAKPIAFNVEGGKLASTAGTDTTVVTIDANAFTVKNAAGAALPNTGGPGLDIVYALAGMLFALAAACVLREVRYRRHA